MSTSREPWTDAEIAHLLYYCSHGLRDQKVGDLIGKTLDAVRSKKKRMNVDFQNTAALKAYLDDFTEQNGLSGPKSYEPLPDAVRASLNN
ncbi:hypothetical protein TWF281_002152 [Arthrobotrys megalospora]